MVAQVTKFEANGRPWFVLQQGPEYMIFKSDWGCADNGDGESGPMPYQYEKPYEQVAGGQGGPNPLPLLERYLEAEEQDDAAKEHVHEYEWKRYCGAKVCHCGDHEGLIRCYCGWSASGGDGRQELRDFGEVIGEDEY